MVTFFPKIISKKAIVTYVVSLVIVSLAFLNYAMSFKFMLFGLLSVLGFFSFSNKLTSQWKNYSERTFKKKIFWTSFAIRFGWVIFSYFFFLSETGTPFEWSAADSLSYHELPAWMVQYDQFSHIKESFKTNMADCGQFSYVYLIYKIVGYEGWFPIVFVRFLKAIWSALTCMLIYELAKRNFGDSIGRMAAIFCMLMPNLIMYSGLQLKETEMIFLCVFFLERADALLRGNKISFVNIAIVALLAFSLFFYRTVLGAVAVISFLVALVLSSKRMMKGNRRILLIMLSLVFAIVVAGNSIMSEVESYWNGRGSNQAGRRYEQSVRGISWAKYATATVMAPMIFVLPFATMVDVSGQNMQQLLHGGNFVKNFMGVFVIIAFVYLVFVNKKWRDHVLIGAFTGGYLLVVAMSAFANSERFLLPAVPLLLVFSAYGISLLNAKNFKFVKYWSYVVVLMEFGWAFFKLGSRGIVGF